MATIETALPPRYTELDTIAHGGMADVFRASDEILGRVVAIKVLAERWARNKEFRARFLREARTAASLSGERFVIAIYDVGETEDGLPYIVMEYAPGGTVADRLQEGRPEAGLAVRWLEQVASALDTAHARAIVHRDVKPANFLLTADDTVRVSDFGIARAAGNDTLTVAGTVLGSAGYMAPEQARGEPSTAATDRYALACVAYEMFTGRRPFERESMTAEAAAHVNERPPTVLAADPLLPPELDLVFQRGLAKLPHDRFASCRDLVANLRRAIAFGVAGPIIVDEPAPRILRRSTVPRGVAVAGAAALLAGGGLLAWALAEPSGDSETPTVVLTETLQAETVVRTVTTEGETVERTVHERGRRHAARLPGAGSNDEPSTTATIRRERPLPQRPRLRTAPARGRDRCAADARRSRLEAKGRIINHRGLCLVQPRLGALLHGKLRWRHRPSRPLRVHPGLAARDRPPPKPGRGALRPGLKLRALERSRCLSLRPVYRRLRTGSDEAHKRYRASSLSRVMSSSRAHCGARLAGRGSAPAP